ncbi:diaminobutyrate-2-oxoglutarate transaminase [Oxalobacteraceae bacterium GrIS 1.11]
MTIIQAIQIKTPNHASVRARAKQNEGALDIFENMESNARSYSRAFSAVFSHAKGEWLYASDGTCYLDFFAGAGALNYGHNPEVIKRRLIAYLEEDGLIHGLDFATVPKAEFLNLFQNHILVPRGLEYRVQFCSPSGTNAVEAAMKLARLVTGRGNIIAFGGGFHGVSSGSLAATSANYYKRGLFGSLAGVTHVPFPDSPFGSFDSMAFIERMVEDSSSGSEMPAAILLETVQAEGGIYIAPVKFLRELRAFCDRHAILLIVDDIQAGCGRTGSFFSFERANIRPDMVTLSKSIGAYGLPMSLLLIKPECDIWEPGQHNGTFRGNQMAFLAGAEAIRQFWSDDGFELEIARKSAMVGDFLRAEIGRNFDIQVRGLGLIWGIDMSKLGHIKARAVSKMCFERGLVVETCGRDDEVLKILPPLSISEANLTYGLELIHDVMQLMHGKATEPRIARRNG